MTFGTVRLGLCLAAAVPTLVAMSKAPGAETLFFPNLVYRTGAYGPTGVPIANGLADYYALINERDGGVEGVKIVYEECETGFNAKVGLECYEKLKRKDALLFYPLSTGITYLILAKAHVDKIPILSMGYGRADSADGRVFPWIFNFPATYWSQASALIRHLGHQEGGMDKLKDKKIALIYHNSTYGREPIPILRNLEKKYKFKLSLLAVDHPGQEQKTTWWQIRRTRPDYILLWGWGVMNRVAIKKAAAIGYPMDRLIGVWSSASKIDVVPAGKGAIGYKASTFHAPGANRRVHQDILKYLYNKGRGAGEIDRVGEVLYNRGLFNALVASEAARDAIKKHGKKITGTHMREALENLNLTEARLVKLGFGGFTKPIKVTCKDHETSGAVLIQQWDGKRWKIASKWLEPIKEV
ncbi:MAG: ABC transporter substrate-binding protein, partial [Pseudomonadota bacterium]